MWVFLGECPEPPPEDHLDFPRTFDEVSGLDLGQRTDARRAGGGVAAVGAAEPTWVHRVHDVRASSDSGQWETASHALRHCDEVRHHPFMVTGEHIAGACEAGLDFVGDEHDSVGCAVFGNRGQKTRRWVDESAFAGDRFDDHCRDVAGPELPIHPGDGVTGRISPGAAVSEWVGPGDAVDLRRKRPEVLLVGHVLRRQRQGQVGASVVTVFESHDGITAGGVARDLDRVLHGFRPGIEQGGALLVITGGHPVEPFAHIEIQLVRGHHEAGVGEDRNLLLNLRHHLRRRVAHRGDRDSRP